MNKLSVYLFTGLFFALAFGILEYPKFKAFNDGLLHIYFLDVGQGDASLIKLPSKKLVLVDGGPRSGLEDLISEKVPFTVQKIDLVVVSHSHADHINGLLGVLENYEVGCIVYDMQDKPISESESELRDQISSRKVKVVDTRMSDENKRVPAECFEDADVNFSVYSLYGLGELPETLLNKNQNFESNIVLLKYKAFETLFTGDAEIEVQADILPYLKDNIEVLKAPHHGSTDAYYAPTLIKLAPDYAIFSVGEDNSYGHPDAEVTKGYHGLGVKYLRTDQNGDIEVKTDGTKWNVSSENR